MPVNKWLADLYHEAERDDVVRFSEDGSTVLVDMGELLRRGRNVASYRRNLHRYRFKKVSGKKGSLEGYSNPLFKRMRQDLLEKLERQKPRRCRAARAQSTPLWPISPITSPITVDGARYQSIIFETFPKQANAATINRLQPMSVEPNASLDWASVPTHVPTADEIALFDGYYGSETQSFQADGWPSTVALPNGPAAVGFNARNECQSSPALHGGYAADEFPNAWPGSPDGGFGGGRFSPVTPATTGGQSFPWVPSYAGPSLNVATLMTHMMTRPTALGPIWSAVLSGDGGATDDPFLSAAADQMLIDPERFDPGSIL